MKKHKETGNDPSLPVQISFISLSWVPVWVGALTLVNGVLAVLVFGVVSLRVMHCNR